MVKNKEELDFLENYYNFYLKKHGENSMAHFITTAQKTLVDSGQISQASLDSFQNLYYMQQELKKKEAELEKLKKEIEVLKRKTNVQPIVVGDGCGHGGGVSSSHC